MLRSIPVNVSVYAPESASQAYTARNTFCGFGAFPEGWCGAERFETQDLFDGKNMDNVFICIMAVASRFTTLLSRKRLVYRVKGPVHIATHAPQMPHRVRPTQRVCRNVQSITLSLPRSMFFLFKSIALSM